MPIRITQNQVARDFQSGVLDIYERMSVSQRQLSTGNRIERPSDDPFAAGQVLGFDAQLADVRQFQRNTIDALGFLDTEDAALGTVTDALGQVRDLLVQASNGTVDQNGLNAIAAEITQLKETVRDGANARHGNQYVFSATSVDQPPYPAPGNLYAGVPTPAALMRRVSANQTVPINIDSPQIFGPNGGNTFDLLDQIVTDLTGGNRAALPGHITNIDAQIDNVLNIRTRFGATTARIETNRDQLEALEERLMSARSEIADVDFAEAYATFQNQQTMYQAALSSGTRILQSTILDFI